MKGLESGTKDLSLAECDSERLDTPALLREKYYQDIAKLIFRRARPVLSETTEEDSQTHWNELLEMIRNAGAFAARLFTQKVKMVVVQSWRKEDDAFRFDIRSSRMTPHPSMLLDEDSHEFDGCMIDFMVEPAIIAYGNEAGRNYDEWKIFMKMTVLLFDQNEMRRHGQYESGQMKRRSPNSSRNEPEESREGPKRTRIEEATKFASLTQPSATQQLLDAAREPEAGAPTERETRNAISLRSGEEWKAPSSSTGDARLRKEDEMKRDPPQQNPNTGGMQSAHEPQGKNMEKGPQYPQQQYGSKVTTAQGLLPASSMSEVLGSISADKADAFDERQRQAEAARRIAARQRRNSSQAASRMSGPGGSNGGVEKVRNSRSRVGVSRADDE